ncbi:MAG: AAA family ATPase, partial [Methanospirillum sp.]|uniref:ATP-binding protein n=1 Tax=Methanospirillum sp. TaxID=45200 RepID=UPI002370B2C0
KPNLYLHSIPDPSKLKKELLDTLNNRTKVNINLLQNEDIQDLEIQGKTLIRIHVPRATRKQRPVYIGSNPLTGTYIRKHESDYLCSAEHVKQMLGEQAQDTRDAVLLSGFSFEEDVEKESFRIYRQNFQNRKPEHPFNECDDREFMRQIGGWAKERSSGKEGLTLAGLLMFGKFRSILDAIPNYIVDYQERAGTETRWVDRVTTDGSWSGNLYDFYRIVTKKLFTDLKVPFQLEGDHRIEDTPVHEALREAFVNTLIHADYSGSCSILVVKRPDLYGFRNPGLMRVPKFEALRGGTSDCRNRNLQKMFQFLGRGEQAGSGVPMIFQNWAKQHWREPYLDERSDSNQTVLKLKMISLVPEPVIRELNKKYGAAFQGLSQLEQEILIAAGTEECVNHQRMKELVKDHPHDISRSLHALVEHGFLESDGSGKATFYYLPGKHPMQDEMFGVHGSSNEVSSVHMGESPVHLTASLVHLEGSSDRLIDDPDILPELQGIAKPVFSTGKASKELIEETIIRLCEDRFLTIDELATLLNRNKNSLRSRYISQMIVDGRLIQKYRNVPSHPNQKYTTAFGGKKEDGS